MSPRFGDLPVAVQLFFGAHEKDETLLAHLFAPDAVVTERARLFKGIASVTAWHRDYDARHPAHWVEVLGFSQRGERQIRARVRVRGDFPASPLDLLYSIQVRDHRIVAINVCDAPIKKQRRAT